MNESQSYFGSHIFIIFAIMMHHPHSPLVGILKEKECVSESSRNERLHEEGEFYKKKRKSCNADKMTLTKIKHKFYFVNF